MLELTPYKDVGFICIVISSKTHIKLKNNDVTKDCDHSVGVKCGPNDFNPSTTGLMEYHSLLNRQ